MGFTIAGSAFFGALCSLNLLLTFGVIRRLREHTELISRLNGRRPAGEELSIGDLIGDFTVESTDGVTLDRASVKSDTLVAFFSPNCDACEVELPAFVAHSARISGDQGRPIAVVSGTPEAAADFVGRLEPVADVVLEPYVKAMTSAFRVRNFPTRLGIGPDRSGRVVLKDDRPAISGIPAAE